MPSNVCSPGLLSSAYETAGIKPCVQAACVTRVPKYNASYTERFDLTTFPQPEVRLTYSVLFVKCSVKIVSRMFRNTRRDLLNHDPTIRAIDNHFRFEN